jgi:hypothetical protein
MTSLQNILKDEEGNLILDPSKPAGNGQLQAQAQAGQTPLTPAAAAEGGAGPDAAKMAGTPAQTSAPTVLPQAPAAPTAPATPPPGQLPAPGTRLRDAMRLEQPGAAGPSEAERKRMAEGARLQAQFGALGSRIQSLIETGGFLAPPGGAPAPATAGLLGDISKLTPEQQAAVQKVANNPSDMAAIAAAKQLGIDPFSYMTDVSTAAGNQASQATVDKIMFTPETAAQMGFDPAQVAASLGIPPEKLAQMSLQDVQAALGSKVDLNHSNTEALKKQAVDPALGPNERAQARAQLKAAGVTGVFASEADMARLDKSVESADQVEFNGKVMSVAELLDDDFMSGLVKEYVDSTEDSEVRKQLREKEPQLAAWIDEHAAALQEASVQMEGGANQYKEIQAGAQAVQDSLTSAGGLPADVATAVMKQLDPNWNPGFMTEAVDPAQYPGIQLLTGKVPPPEGFNPGVFQKNFSSLAKVSPEAAAALARLPPEELAKLGAGQQDSKQFASYMQYVQDWVNVSKLDPNDPEAAIDYIFGPDASVQSIQEMFTREYELAKRTGSESSWFSTTKKALDADGDGRIDAQLTGNLKDMLGGGNAIKLPTALGNQEATGMGRLRKLTRDADFYRSLGPAASDGRITSEELPNIVSGADIGTLKQLLTSTGVELDKGARNRLEDEIGQREITDVATAAMQEHSLPVAQIDNMIQGKYKPTRNEAAAMREQIKKVWQAIEAETNKRVDESGGVVSRTTLIKYANHYRAALAKLDQFWPE